MTRTENLAAIRSACVVANPEIEKQEVNSRTNESARRQVIHGWEPRPIRLADVLVAAQDFCGPRWFDTHVTPIVDVWNLRTDDLEQQSDETISFIHSLIG